MRRFYWFIDLLNYCFNEAGQYATYEAKRSSKKAASQVSQKEIPQKLSVSVKCLKCVVESDLKWTELVQKSLLYFYVPSPR